MKNNSSDGEIESKADVCPNIDLTSMANELKSTMSDVQTNNHKNNHLAKVKSCLASKMYLALPWTVCSQDSLDTDCFWDVSIEICKMITQKVFTENEALFDACEKCLDYLVKEGNKKEMFYVLIEQLQTASDQMSYEYLVHYALKIVCTMNDKQCFLSCDTLLTAANAYINSLPLHKPNANLEGDERKLIAHDSTARAISEAIDVLLSAVTVYLDRETIDQNVKNTILGKLFHILDKQLIFLHIGCIDPDNKKVPSGYGFYTSQKLVKIVARISPDFYKLFMKLLRSNEKFLVTANQLDNEDSTDSKAEYSDLSIACFLYLVIAESMDTNNWPSMLSSHHLLHLTLPSIITLLSRTEDLIIYKAVYFAEAILQKFPRYSLDYGILDDPNTIKFIDKTINVMLHCIVIEYRQRCLKILQEYIQKFDASGRYKIYFHIVHANTHAGVIGYIIGLIKEEINRQLSDGIINENFSDEKLEQLVGPVLHIPDSVSTDLLTESDRIIAGLNFIRYLAIRIPTHNDTIGFWNRIHTVEELFLEPLKNCLKHSRLNYKNELQLALEQKDRKDKGEPEVEVRVGETVVPPMLEGRHIDIMEGGLRMFDLIESLHARVAELINTNKGS